MRHPSWFCVAVALALTLPGCGSKTDHVACFPVGGQVLVGGQPAGGVLVRFYNKKNPGNVDAPQPQATTDDQGLFELMTFDPGDGAPADEYVVVLLWPDGPIGAGVPRDKLGNAYTDPTKTPFTAVIKTEPTKLEPFRIDPANLKKSKVKQTEATADPNVPG